VRRPAFLTGSADVHRATDRRGRGDHNTHPDSTDPESPTADARPAIKQFRATPAHSRLITSSAWCPLPHPLPAGRTATSPPMPRGCYSTQARHRGRAVYAGAAQALGLSRNAPGALRRLTLVENMEDDQIRQQLKEDFDVTASSCRRPRGSRAGTGTEPPNRADATSVSSRRRSRQIGPVTRRGRREMPGTLVGAERMVAAASHQRTQRFDALRRTSSSVVT